MAKLSLIVLLALLFVGCSSQRDVIVVSGTTLNAEQIAQGQQLYAQYCASCHGVNGEGQFPNAPTERDATGRFGAPPHNGNGHTWHHGDAMLVEYVRNGGMSLTDPTNWYPMPAFGEQITDEQIMLTLAYIKTFWNDEQLTRQMQVTAAEGERESNPLQINPGG
ncbi:MAG: cytochrome c [Anaerolineae bacterium]|nr:cytochrome c [Anaerolineae bacterium]NUQ04902.1 cytochrome c [Anaerolineae bacterium]